jgi:hypothetical protein
MTFKLKKKTFISKLENFLQKDPKTLAIIFFGGFGFYIPTTQFRSYGNFPALLVEEHLRCLST